LTKTRAKAKRARAKNASSGLSDSIASIAARDPVQDTPEQRRFDKRIAELTKMSRRTTGVIGPGASAPLLSSGKFVRRTQYIRDLNEPEPLTPPTIRRR
jgi:hypothetical protein